METKHLYLLPGTMCDHRLWVPMAEALEQLAPKNYQMHYLAIAKLDCIDDIILDIKRQIVANQHDESGVALIGFSLGGYLASEFILKYPEIVAKLMLVANMSKKLSEKALKERKRTVNWLKQHGYSGIALKRIYALLDETNREQKAIIDVIKAMDTDLGQATLIHQLEVTTKRQDLLADIVSSTVPTHFCIGESDCLVDIEKVRQHCSTSNFASVSVIKATGHMLPLENPENLAKEIHNYFSMD